LIEFTGNMHVCTEKDAAHPLRRPTRKALGRGFDAEESTSAREASPGIAKGARDRARGEG
jgi:hypothetical protein